LKKKNVFEIPCKGAGGVKTKTCCLGNRSKKKTPEGGGKRKSLKASLWKKGEAKRGTVSRGENKKKEGKRRRGFSLRIVRKRGGKEWNSKYGKSGEKHMFLPREEVLGFGSTDRIAKSWTGRDNRSLCKLN